MSQKNRIVPHALQFRVQNIFLDHTTGGAHPDVQNNSGGLLVAQFDARLVIQLRFFECSG
jgi:hypothetical protein